MASKFWAICILLNLWSVHVGFAYSANLKFVQILFRHGDRSPTYKHSGDPTTEDMWSQGWGALTSLGIQQEYMLGLHLRQRYGSFLGPDFEIKDVYVRSVDVNRCLLSAQANVAAFFQPFNATQQWDSVNITDDNIIKKLAIGKIWQPVPVHTAPVGQDFMLSEATCPKFVDLDKDLDKLPQMQKLLAENKDTINYIAQATNGSGTLESTWDITDSVLCNLAHNHTLSWTNETYFRQKMYPIMEQVMMAFGGGTDDHARLVGGTVLYTMLDQFDKASRNHTDREYDDKPGPHAGVQPNNDDEPLAKKMVMYASHDTILVGTLAALRVLDQVWSAPRYASAIIMEMYDDNTVQVLYKNLTSSFTNATEQLVDLWRTAPHPLSVATCGTRCTLQQLRDASHGLTQNPDEWFTACHYGKTPCWSGGCPSSRSAVVAAVIGWLLIGALLIAGGLYACVARHRRNDFERF